MLTWWLPGCISYTDTSFPLRFVLNTKGLRYSKVAMDYYERRLPFYHYQLSIHHFFFGIEFENQRHVVLH